MVPGLYYLLVDGLKLGIDFTGGTRLTVAFSQTRPDPETVKTSIADLALGSITVQPAGEREMVLRLPAVTNDQRQAVLTRLNEKFPAVEERSFDSIGPTIGRELLQKSIIALGIVLLAIIIYISWAFRKVNVGTVPAWAYGLSAIIALIHDVVLVVGSFAMLGRFFGYEVDSLFVTALLTVLGFSVHDTIVVFDRVRERLLQGTEPTFEDTVNVSLNQTLVRSLNTSITTLLVLVVLAIFGGESIRPFVVTLTIGIASGTYSSIFVASPLLVVYERFKAKKLARV